MTTVSYRLKVSRLRIDSHSSSEKASDERFSLESTLRGFANRWVMYAYYNESALCNHYNTIVRTCNDFVKEATP